MKVKKSADEMEKFFTSNASKVAFFFYSISLLVWSFYDLLTTNKLGIPFIIMCAGTILFMLTLIIQKRKIKKLEKKG